LFIVEPYLNKVTHMTKLVDLPGLFARTKAGQKMLEEERTLVRTERQKLVDRIAAIRKEKEEKVAELNARLEPARERLQAAEQAFNDAAAAFGDIYAERRRVVLQLDHEVSALEMELRRTADPAIEEFGRELMDMHEKTRWIRPYDKAHLEAIRARLEAIMHERRALDDLELRAEVDLKAEFAAALSRIPTV